MVPPGVAVTIVMRVGFSALVVGAGADALGGSEHEMEKNTRKTRQIRNKLLFIQVTPFFLQVDFNESIY
jgi:hypothetical protein